MPRSRKPINYELVEKLAMIGCTHEEIAHALDTTTVTLTKSTHFLHSFKKGSTGGKRSLRHHMFQLVQQGSVPMCIFLAKNWLGMKDVHVQQHEGEVTVNAGVKERLVSKLAAKPVSAEPVGEGNQLVN